MDFLPLNIQLHNKPCLIIGGGSVALRKAQLLAKAGAVVNVVALSISDDLLALSAQTGGASRIGEYQSSDLEQIFLAIAATDDNELNARISRDAHTADILVNVVDQPKLCSFILPAIIDRSPLLVAVSSGGKSPVLARMLRAKIESSVPAAYGQLAELLGRFRDKVKQRFSSPEQRRRFWEQTLEGPVAEMVLAGKPQQAKDMLTEQLQQSSTESKTGEVYLVGAGPGDPDLLTFKALRLMQKADVVLYDRLVSEPILELVRRDAEKMYVGKARSNHSVPQSTINKLLVELAQQGKRVLRLKGGDPFIFGRGGEEIEPLAEHNISFQVVPGITAASGCASYAGIPLTHRDYAQSVRFLTGHLKDGSIDLPWSECLRRDETLVFYMGLVGLPLICRQLIDHGRHPDTPIALVQQGTTQNHRLVVSTLADMPAKLNEESIKAPTLIIIGDVVKMHEKLAWYGQY